MSHYYGSIRAAFHGKAADLRKLAPLVWKKPELAELADGLNVDPALDGDAVTTITVDLFGNPLNTELPCIDFLADRCPKVEIAVTARISDSVTDMEGRCSTFYPLGRKTDVDEEGEDEVEDDTDDNDDDYDALDYVSYIQSQMQITASLIGYNGDEYEIDLCDEAIRPEGWDFWAEDPDLIEWLSEEELAEQLEPRTKMLVKCDPKTGEITQVKGFRGSIGEILPDIQVKEKDGKRFYIDEKGCEYFPLGEIPAEEFEFGRSIPGWFEDDPDRPDWLREWEG